MSYQTAQQVYQQQSVLTATPQELALMLYNAGIQCEAVFRISEGRPNLLDLLSEKRVNWIVNTPETGAAAMVDEIRMRSGAVAAGTPITTTLSAFTVALEGLTNSSIDAGRMTVCSLQEYHRHLFGRERPMI